MKQYCILCLSFCVILIFYTSASAQTIVLDSLLGLLQTSKNDSEKIYLNYRIGEHLTGYDGTKADKYFEAGFNLAKTKEDTYNIAYYFQHKGESLFDKAKYRESSMYYDSAIALYDGLLNSEKETNRSEIYKYGRIDCLTGKGLLSAKLYQYQQSINYYLQCIAELEHLTGNKKNSHLATLYADIASNYYELEQFNNALKYDKEALPFLDKNVDIDLFVIGHLFVADDYSGLLQFDSSSVYLEKVRPTIMQLNKPILNIRFYYILGGIYRKKKEWNNALSSFIKANESAKKIKDDFQVLNSEEGMAACYIQLSNLDKARELALHVFTESNRLNIPLGKVQALQLLTEIEEKAGNIEKAFEYQKQYIQLSDSVKQEKVQRQMNEIEAKYQSEKKQKEILQLQKDQVTQTLSIKQKSALNYFLTGAIAALLILGLLTYRNMRHRQLLAKQQGELQQQLIRELEKDKQLIAVDSMLKGQEDERGRLAKDLHDGLGGLLSGVKYSLINMKDNMIITKEHAIVFERSLDMIDSSINELRRVAHNMMPEALIKFGLDEALKDYCAAITNSNILKVQYQSFGMDERIESNTEIIIYRIVQELLNNTIKHATATEVLVQIVRESERMSITVEDNGKGFDIQKLENSKGAGWANIKSRVDYLKGKLDLHSEKGKGTSVSIDCPLTAQGK